MKLEITQQWLAGKLAQADDSMVSACATDIEQLRKDVQLRTVTPTIFSEHSTTLSKVVRFVREQRGWSRQTLADIASIDEEEVNNIETMEEYTPSPRSIIYLADALGFSRDRFKELVGFVVKREVGSSSGVYSLFAANSKGIDRISESEYEAVRVMVEVLSNAKT